MQGYPLLRFAIFVFLSALPLSVALLSEGCDDPGISACGIASIKINNQEYSFHGRGFNVAVFTRQGAFKTLIFYF